MAAQKAPSAVFAFEVRAISSRQSQQQQNAMRGMRAG
jgi:hypothetical protein